VIFKFVIYFFMIITPQQFIVSKTVPITKETFDSNCNTWEIVDIPEEKSYIKDNYYWMHNKAESSWKYYKINTTLTQDDSWLMYAEIELLNKNEFGHFGLVWGFDQHRERLNRFTVSADRERSLILHFEKDHRHIFHRHQYCLHSVKQSAKIRMMIVKGNDFFYFYINDSLIYIAAHTHFAHLGQYSGFYIEPGLFIRSGRFDIYRLQIEKTQNNGFSELIR